MIFRPFRDFIIKINYIYIFSIIIRCSLAKISMVAEPSFFLSKKRTRCSLAKISMVAEQDFQRIQLGLCCSLAKISMVAEQRYLQT